MNLLFFGVVFAVALTLFFAAAKLENKFFALVGGALFLLFGLQVMHTGVCFQEVANTTISSDGYWEYADMNGSCYPCDANATCYGVEDDVNTSFGGSKTTTTQYRDKCLEPAEYSLAFGTILLLLGLYSVLLVVLNRLRGD